MREKKFEPFVNLIRRVVNWIYELIITKRERERERERARNGVKRS